MITHRAIVRAKPFKPFKQPMAMENKGFAEVFAVAQIILIVVYFTSVGTYRVTIAAARGRGWKSTANEGGRQARREGGVTCIMMCAPALGVPRCINHE